MRFSIIVILASLGLTLAAPVTHSAGGAAAHTISARQGISRPKAGGSGTGAQRVPCTNCARDAPIQARQQAVTSTNPNGPSGGPRKVAKKPTSRRQVTSRPKSNGSGDGVKKSPKQSVNRRQGTARPNGNGSVRGARKGPKTAGIV